MARQLSMAAVIRWHDYLIARDGGRLGLRDPGLLASALAAPKQVEAYGGGDLYDQAAALCYSVANNHAFLDGNKRTAFACLDVFLRRNGRRVRFPPEWVEVMVGVGSGCVSRAALADALRSLPYMPTRGRRRRNPEGPARVRPGVPLTAGEYAAIRAYAEREAIPIVEAMRRLMARGLSEA
jgi:death-on-curing protein